MPAGALRLLALLCLAAAPWQAHGEDEAPVTVATGAQLKAALTEATTSRIRLAASIVLSADEWGSEAVLVTRNVTVVGALASVGSKFSADAPVLDLANLDCRHAGVRSHTCAQYERGWRAPRVDACHSSREAGPSGSVLAGGAACSAAPVLLRRPARWALAVPQPPAPLPSGCSPARAG